ncbi:MAG TPA: HipA domain-containing protein [Cytophagaceae bacterium]|jgi:serine/threonine-protein kinase HipA|nr:HipA domain-containing protein [Cytophagaceae bacterium]
MICQGCLKEIKAGTFCKKCRKELFDGENISLILDFASPANEGNEALMKNVQHISISGVQIKYSLKREAGKLVLTESAGQYILKPIPIGPFQKLDLAPANEHLTMQIARQVFKIPTAVCAIVFFNDNSTPAYLTRRFDVKADGTRSQQEDFAQLAQLNEQNAGRNYKYDYSYQEVAELIKKYVATYPVELETFFKIVIFNYLFNNGDAHLKNFSVYRTEYGDYRLTPAYDVMNTKIHIPTDTDFALTKGLFKDDFETESHNVNGFNAYDDFLEFGKRIGIKESRTRKIIESFLHTESEVIALTANSFLTDEIKERYITLFKDKLKAMTYSYSHLRKE